RSHRLPRLRCCRTPISTRAPSWKRHSASRETSASTPIKTSPSKSWKWEMGSRRLDCESPALARDSPSISNFLLPIPAPMSELTPREIVNELDRYIIGQNDAKRAVAIALRNRWRRMQIDPDFRDEVTPKNILMIGPTGVGKTEIARRLATLANAPFVKVEATKFTEVGYVGKDVDSIVRDLADISYKLTRDQAKTRVQSQAEERAEERILDALLPHRQAQGWDSPPPSETDSATRQKLLRQLHDGALDE